MFQLFDIIAELTEYPYMEKSQRDNKINKRKEIKQQKQTPDIMKIETKDNKQINKHVDNIDKQQDIKQCEEYENIKQLIKKTQEMMIDNKTYIIRLNNDIDTLEYVIETMGERLTEETKQELQNIIDQNNESIDEISNCQRRLTQKLNKLYKQL